MSRRFTSASVSIKKMVRKANITIEKNIIDEKNMYKIGEVFIFRTVADRYTGMYPEGFPQVGGHIPPEIVR